MINPYIIYKSDEFYQKTRFHFKPVARPDGRVVDDNSSQLSFLMSQLSFRVKKGTQVIYRKGDILLDWGSLAGNLTLGIDMEEGTAAIKSQPDVMGIAWVDEATGKLVEWDPNETISE